MEIKLHNICWDGRVMQSRSTFTISINKLVANGCNLEKGQILYSYLAEDEGQRPIIIIYLDGKKRKV